MRKAVLLLIALYLGLGLKAQCPLAEAVDFTATDCHGTEVHLFDILDGGQYVLIDFFFYNCGMCNTTVPMIVQSYEAFGCNMHDVFYMEISDRDSDALCQDWTTKYGVEYPTISAAAGGNTITHQYGISSWSTVILIAPDRQIVIHDLWPLSNVQDIITALENKGLTQHECTTDIEEHPQAHTLFPNPASESITIKGDNLRHIDIFNVLGHKVDSYEATGNELHIHTDNYVNGVYFAKTNETILRFVIIH